MASYTAGIRHGAVLSQALDILPIRDKVYVQLGRHLSAIGTRVS
jgi:hypothetical protein